MGGTTQARITRNVLPFLDNPFCILLFILIGQRHSCAFALHYTFTHASIIITSL